MRWEVGEDFIFRTRWRGRAAVALFVAWTTPAIAGLSLDEALARDRAFSEGLRQGRSVLTPLSLESDVADGLTFGVGGPGNDVPSLLRPQLRGDGGAQLRAGSSVLDGRVQLRFGAAWWPGADHPYSFDESSISSGLGPGRVYASVERRHWGPAWSNSLILDSGARPVPAVGWRKTDPRPFQTWLLSWLGPWNADFFAGELAQRSGPRHARLLGARFQFMPIKNLELGISRTAQWGGSGRPESLKSFGKALLSIGDNVDSGDTSQEPGNQLAGFDARYTLRFSSTHSASVYIQAIGEDEAGYRPSHYLGTVGADTAFRLGGASLRVFVEYANTACSGLFKQPLPGCAYVHHIYTDGYTQLGDPLGHPAGGDVRLTSVGAYLVRGAWSGALLLHHGSAYPTSTLYGKSGGLDGVNAELAWQLTTASRLGAALFY
ncbi:MAG: capsule assembly Wzi family protein, partial [Pseudomonadota bacterium]|nr:capsule assembly Wzi family protein [Pseudomonadota bacterium]